MKTSTIDWTKLKYSLRSAANALDLRVLRALTPWGFREIGLGLVPIRQGSGPGEPPIGFVGGTTSKTEWFVYWALTKLLGKEGMNWTYQESFQGGRHIPGGSVVDFVVYTPMQTILIRVQTWRFHFAGGAAKHQPDIEQKIGLFGIFGEEIVIDVYEQHFIWDESGNAVLRVMSDAIAGIEWPNPLAVGIAGDFS